jgi:hypothetical protein
MSLRWHLRDMSSMRGVDVEPDTLLIAGLKRQRVDKIVVCGAGLTWAEVKKVARLMGIDQAALEIDLFLRALEVEQ